jgi:hypothetical protein
MLSGMISKRREPMRVVGGKVVKTTRPKLMKTKTARTPNDTEDRAAALAFCLFGEIACLDPAERDGFLQGLWIAHEEMVQANAAQKAEASA